MRTFHVSKNTISLLLILFIASSTWANQKTTESDSKPTLYAFVAGFTPPNIKWTENDAMDISDALLTQSGLSNGFYGKAVVEKLIGNEATATNTIKSLKKFIYFNKMRPNDVFVLFMSSHGEYYDGKYFIQASDYDRFVPKKTSIEMGNLMNILDELKNPKLIFIDACESGKKRAKLRKGMRATNTNKIFRNKIKNKSGYTIFTSGPGDTYHHPAWKNGVFTEALLEGFKGQADDNSDGRITTNEIYKYVNHRVYQLCKEQLIKEVQKPNYVRDDLGDFPFYTVSDDICTNIKKLPPADVIPLVNLEAHYKPAYGMIINPKTDTQPEKWEQYPISLFHYIKNGTRYVEGKVAFMGTQDELELRIEISVIGYATSYLGNKAPKIFINLGNEKTFKLFNKHSYQCMYDAKQHKTRYTIVYTINNKQKKLLYSQDINSVNVIWEKGISNYEVLCQHTFLKQLDNIKKAEKDGIIKKQTPKNKKVNFL